MQDRSQQKQTSNHLISIFINTSVPAGAYQFQLFL